MKYIFLFDIDQTLLTISLNSVNKVNQTPSAFIPYERQTSCYTLNKEKMKNILQTIIDNGDEIGFITAGSMKPENIKTFFEKEYNIDLGNNFIFYNRYSTPQGTIKTIKLIRVAERKLLPAKHIFLIDNNRNIVDNAIRFGFGGIYVDNNPEDRTDGTEYLKQLEDIMQQRKSQLEEKPTVQEQEKLPLTQTAPEIKSETPEAKTKKTNSFGKFFSSRKITLEKPKRFIRRLCCSC